MNFIKYVFATVFGLFLFGIISVSLMILVVGSFTSDSEVPTISDNSVLKLTLSKPIREVAQDNPFEELGISPPAQFQARQGYIGLHELRETIQYAQEDERIKGIYLHVNTVKTGYASLLEIREALEAFKSSGKFVYVYSESLSEGTYFLASLADEIYLNPTGTLEMNGLHSETMFFTGLFEKIGLKPQIFRVGDFKAAVEPFFRKNLSDENRLQTTVLLDDLYNFHLQKVSNSRGLSFSEVEKIADSMLVRNAGDALKYRLITDTLYEAEALQKLKEKLEIDSHENINFVKYKKYKTLLKLDDFSYSTNKIAVILTEGGIVTQNGDDDEISPEKVIKQLQEVRKDEEVKAVVLRINSPGGSLLGSDNLWKEIQLTQKEKPVIASMSDVAASGGYYMAMGCEKIVASPVTITGSIGIFGILLNTEGLANGLAGLTFDRVTTGVFSDLGNPNRTMTETEKNIIQTTVNEGYTKFTRKASEGRKMPLDSLLKVASGRVWSGQRSKKIDLVDAIGGFDKAVELAVDASEIEEEDYMLVYYPKKKEFMEQLFSEAEIQYRNQTLKEELGLFYPYAHQLKELQKRQGVQAWLPLKVKF